MWLDNFSKFYAVAIQGVSTGAFSDCLWTGQGVHKYVGPPVDTKIQAGMRGMPVKLCSKSNRDAVEELIITCENRSWRYFAGSVVKRYNVNRIPLKPEVDSKEEPELATVLDESRDGLRNFYPLDVLPENIGSNRGLLFLLRDLFSKPLRTGHFSFLSVDCNIFVRMLKV